MLLLVMSGAEEVDIGQQPCCVIQYKTRCLLANSWLITSDYPGRTAPQHDADW